MSWQTARLGATYDLLAPDGSEIRLLVQTSAGSMVHCTLQPGQVTIAVRHRTVEEVWFCAAGTGELWRRSAASQHAESVALEPGSAVSIPLGTDFQFRAIGPEPLQVIITTMPPWPGEDEAVRVDGAWRPTVA